MSNIGANGHAPASRRLSLGSAIMQPSATPELSRNGSVNSRVPVINGKDLKRERARPTAPLNFVAIDKENSSSGGGSAPASPRVQF